MNCECLLCQSSRDQIEVVTGDVTKRKLVSKQANLTLILVQEGLAIGLEAGVLLPTTSCGGILVICEGLAGLGIE